MEQFGKNLRERAKELKLTNAEVARRLGLSERRYGHYVSGRNEPDLALLMRIAEVLNTTPDGLLGLNDVKRGGDRRNKLIDRLHAVTAVMTDDDLETAVAQGEAVVAMRRR